MSYIDNINLYIFIESSRAAVYGIGSYIRELTLALKGSKVNICVVHLQSDKIKQEIEEQDGVKYWHIPSAKMPQGYENERTNEIYYRNVAFLLRLYIQEKKNIIFHINYWQQRYLVNELKKNFFCKVVFTIHYTGWGFSMKDNIKRIQNMLSKEEEDRTEFEKKTILDMASEKETCLSVDCIVSLTNHMKFALRKFYNYQENNIRIIPNGLSNNAYITDFDKISLRKEWHIKKSEKIVIFAGRIDPIKGLNFLTRAFCSVLETMPDCRMIVAGNGNIEGCIKEAGNACSRIIFTAKVEQTTLYKLFILADVGVIPSLYEPFGYVAVEMMMHGLPIVVTATSGLNEVVDDTCGLKVPLVELPESVEIDSALLAKKILYLLQHPAEARKMGQNGRKRYLKEYSSEVFRRNMLQLYESL